MTVGDVVEAVVKSLIIIVVLLTAFAYMTLYERRFLGRIQVRYGPNRVGPAGLLAAGGRWREARLQAGDHPRGVDKPLYLLAPAISVVTALVAFAVIPVGPDAINIFGRAHPSLAGGLQCRPALLLAMSSLGAYGIVLAGYASNNKYSLLGGLRAAAQLISYELALGLSLVGVLMLSGSLSLTEIVDGQANGLLVHPGPTDRLRDLPDQRDRRDEPRAVRSGRGRAGVGRRLPHRVHRPPLRPLLHGRVHQHGDSQRRSPRRSSSAAGAAHSISWAARGGSC